MITALQQRVLDRLPMPESEWKKVHLRTRRALMAKRLVVMDFFRMICLNPAKDNQHD
jgi:hypothetical protein